MSKKRTKKQKIKAKKTHTSLTNSLEVSQKRKVHKLDYAYDPKLLSKDLLKTLLISGLVMTGQLLLYFFYFK